jgi:hypothetical protein
VRPHDDARARPEPLAQRIERLRHVPVAQVPRFVAAAEHRAVVLLGVADQARVLLGGEELLARGIAIDARERRRAALQVHELLDHRLLAGLVASARREPVVLRIAVVIEARIACSRVPRRCGIHALEVAQHGLDRCVQAVEVQAVQAGLRLAAPAAIVLAQATRRSRARPRCATSTWESA